MNNIYHPGELHVQKLTGEENIGERNGRIVKDSIIKGAINFIEKQPMAIVSSQDRNKQVWVSIIIGDFGFVSIPEPNKLIIKPELINSSKEDVFYDNIHVNPQIGSLFIELSTRRRFRVNGKVRSEENSIKMEIEEAYPNCPKYIQRRVISKSENFKETISKTTKGTILSETEKQWIQKADTFYVGSTSTEGSMDASHRGGPEGFVEILEDGTLKIPDYQGNSMFNTLGNIHQNPNVGLLFVDFKTKSTLQLTGKGELLFNQTKGYDQKNTTGTGRYWLFKTEKWIKTRNHHDVDWEFLDYSPFNP